VDRLSRLPTSSWAPLVVRRRYPLGVLAVGSGEQPNAGSVEVDRSHWTDRRGTV